MFKHFPTFALLFAPWRASPVQRRALLRLIASSVENRLDLGALLEAWAEEEWGAQGIRLRKLAARLREGTPLAEAIEQLPGLLSDEQTLMVRFAAESGSLGPVLRRELEESTERDEAFGGQLRLILNYACFFLIIGAPVALFLQTSILPEMEKIYEEFQIKLPTSTRLAFNTSGLTFLIWWVGTFLLLAALWLRWFSWPTSYFRRVLAPRLLSSLRARRIGSLFQRLSDSASAGRPLAGAISTLARYHYDPALRHKLLVARNELELGSELWPALRDAGLMFPSETDALIAADQTGTRPWTLRTLGEARRERFHRRLRAQAGLLMPLTVLAFGAFVLIQAVGMFDTLMTLINCLV